jgi:hypothetical protein
MSVYVKRLVNKYVQKNKKSPDNSGALYSQDNDLDLIFFQKPRKYFTLILGPVSSKGSNDAIIYLPRHRLQVLLL